MRLTSKEQFEPTPHERLERYATFQTRSRGRIEECTYGQALRFKETNPELEWTVFFDSECADFDVETIGTMIWLAETTLRVLDVYYLPKPIERFDSFVPLRIPAYRPKGG